jgi:type I restriction-modification system DNA methylase subunit
MPLFQKSVLNKFIKSQDNVKIEAAYQRFSDIFLQVDRQSEIRSMKEEEYQDGFLDDLFVNILGYIKRPNAGFNLVREKKNEADSKKADGAILKNDSPLAVIELKGTDTTDLDKVTNQGFGYKNNHKECVYVVISNFEKLRFFIHHAVDYIEFNLFTLSKEEFTTLWLCLHSDNLLDNIPAKIKAESVVKEEDITKNLYKDYSTFKQELWQDIVRLNPNGDPLQFYKKTQKLIDRFLFIFFAEDAGLLPPNSISRMVDRWKMLKDEDAYKPLYEIFKQYFGYINTGRPGKTPQDEIFAYNGGLMLEDDVLESIIISDEVLLKHVSRLTTYDFSSEVDVNILGHIFENSLYDIEAVTAELEGQEIDKSKTKRKKDGVFYTPKYITKYIVDNTVGKLCDEKKVELNIVDEEYAKGRTNRKKETIKQLDENLQAYRNWLLNITICDPACGSGAFLNQALEYLMEEHCYIDELESQLLGAGFTFPGVENHILENNIFGVDINEESIEIAKLSLWLRTAQRGRKLTSLNNNIKCGNSLIDDPEVAGEKAFNWQKEFPTVFEKSSSESGRSSGFDVVIGNPPYGAKLDNEIQNYLNKKYIKGGSETVISFTKLSYDLLLKSGGCFGFIIPKSFSFSSNYQSIREFLFDDINEIIDCKKVWKEVLLEQIMFFFQKGNSVGSFKSGILSNRQIELLGDISKSTFDEFGFYLNGISNKELEIAQKINISKKYFKDISSNTRGGALQKIISESGDLKVIGGAEIQRNGVKGIKGFIDKKKIENDKKSFIQSNSILVQNLVAHIENPTDHIKITACYPNELDYVIVDTINQLTFHSQYDSKTFWLILNSKLINWYSYRFIYAKAIRTMHFDNAITNRIPIPVSFNQQPFIDKADLLLQSNKDILVITQKFISLLQSDFNLEKPSKKMEEFYKLTWSEFEKELNKNKITLLGVTKDDWFDRFDRFKKQGFELKSQINQTDKEIDRMVYELYGLTQEEIQIVEGI